MGLQAKTTVNYSASLLWIWNQFCFMHANLHGPMKLGYSFAIPNLNIIIKEWRSDHLTVYNVEILATLSRQKWQKWECEKETLFIFAMTNFTFQNSHTNPVINFHMSINTSHTHHVLHAMSTLVNTQNTSCMTLKWTLSQRTSFSWPGLTCYYWHGSVSKGVGP